MTNPTPVLELQNVSKLFPLRSNLLRRTIGQIRAVDRATLTVSPGETLGLVGESGSGKSTLGRLGPRLIEPTAGRILLAGHDITEVRGTALRSARRDVQMVFQDPYSSLDPHAPVSSSIGEPLQTHLGMSGKERTKRVAELLEQVRLSPTSLERYPHEFSGGQLQRIALARALALNPKVIVADEPVSSLDVSTQAQILRLLEQLQEELGIAYLFISHDLSVVHHVSARIAVMYLGRIIEIGTAEEVIARPSHPYTQALLSAVPTLDPADKKRDRIVLAGDPPSPANPPPGCHFHTRCGYVMDICKVEEPAATHLPGGSTVHCHLYQSNEQPANQPPGTPNIPVPEPIRRQVHT